MSTSIGLDLGPNSIGWAVIDNNRIIKSGSRIIPMDENEINDYEKGKLKSAASDRTASRSIRRLYERKSLRRERLLRVLNTLGFLPEHFKEQTDFDIHPGKFKNGNVPLLPFFKNGKGKSVFVFQDSYREMLEDFRGKIKPGTKIPYDWTIYYLRKKALTKPITKEELAWILLNANSKRGYCQLNENLEETGKRKEYIQAKITKIEDTEDNKGQRITYEGDIVQVCKSRKTYFKVGNVVELIKTTQLDKNGLPRKDKNGNIKYTISNPQEEDWGLIMEKTQSSIKESGLFIGEYIYSKILSNPSVKIKGGIVKTIERQFYRKELTRILDTQTKSIPELSDRETYMECVRELYRNNDIHVEELKNKSIAELFLNDIIYYQRPLKSKKSCIADCPYESYSFANKETGEIISHPLKAMPLSDPLFQEFRLWQFIKNIRIRQNKCEIDGKTVIDKDVTSDILGRHEQLARLFEGLSQVKKFDREKVFKILGIDKKTYSWNYNDKDEYEALTTNYEITSRWKKISSEDIKGEELYKIWQMLYSISDRDERERALKNYAKRNKLDESAFYDSFKNFPELKKGYASYSKRAIKKLLSLMRAGKYWNKEAIKQSVLSRIEAIIEASKDESLSGKTNNRFSAFKDVEDFQGLQVADACYAVYGRHSESSDHTRWTVPEDIDRYLKNEFYKNSMRNPVVEIVVAETLRVVRDIWKLYGKPEEIHIEMARDLKLPNAKRKEMTTRIAENQKENQKLRRKLRDLYIEHTENVRPDSPIQLLKYKLWLEQGGCSVYTGNTIPVASLFTPHYQIDHIIPRTLYYDDSFNNKVVCESDANKDKGAELAYNYISKNEDKNMSGKRILSKEEYEKLVVDVYGGKNKKKLKNLLLTKVPASFNSSQLNNTRYIARKTAEILSHIVREETDDPNAISKNIIMTNGSITDRLKKDWGLNQIWNRLVAPRFIRMNNLTGTNDYGSYIKQNGEEYFQIDVPDDIAETFNKKRIDHRHHAMDAIVVACTTLSHINYMNNISAHGQDRKDLRSKLCEKKYTDHTNYSYRFKVPWESFTKDAFDLLNCIVVSFKQNNHILRRTNNRYWHYVDGKKVLDEQKGENMSVRKPLHKATYSGAIRMPEKKTERIENTIEHPEQIVDRNIRKELLKVLASYKGKATKAIIKKYVKDHEGKLNGIDVSKVEIRYLPEQTNYSAHRVTLESISTDKQLESVTDEGIKNILRKHLAKYGNKYDEAFSPSGIEELNTNIIELNNGHDHKPIRNVRIKETCSAKFALGENGSKKKALVEAEKGTNLFFAIYQDEDGKRYFKTISLREAICNKKLKLPTAQPFDEKGHRLLFVLSPGDLVYIPQENEHVCLPIDTKRIYKMVSTDSNKCFFIPETIAIPIKDKFELGKKNKSERVFYGIYEATNGEGNILDENNAVQIKKKCIKLETDRLGNIIKLIGND